MLLGTQRINSKGRLEIGGCDTIDLAGEFGTPLYVMDEAAIRENCRRYRAAFAARYPAARVYFAGKAFLTGAMVRIAAQEGLWLDVASLGELYLALKAGFPPSRIAVHGNNKSTQDLELAVDARVGHVVADNFLELEILAEVLRDRRAEVDVMVRATPGVDPKTHRLIRTGQADTKFGFNISDGSAMAAIRRILSSAGMRFAGIHCHVGSQLLDTETHEQAVEIMVGLMRAIHEETGAEVQELNVGGGLGVRYLSTHQPPSYEEFAERITAPLKAALTSAGLPAPALATEPGRALVAETGTTLYTIGAIKSVPTTEPPYTRTYVAVDGGLSDNPRPQMYEAVYECIVANKAARPADHTVSIAGKHCETDILIWDTQVAEPAAGDILAVQTTGAYNYVMASNYNRFLRPSVVLVNAGTADVIVERETLDDLLRHDRIPDRLCAQTPEVTGRHERPANESP